MPPSPSPDLASSARMTGCRQGPSVTGRSGSAASIELTARGAPAGWAWACGCIAIDARIDQLVRRIRAEAYRVALPGAHCLGGAYAVSAAFLTAVPLAWRPWVGTALGEDVVVGLLASSAGLRMRSLTAPGEPFALAWRGLPAPPAELVAAGHSIVHSIKRPGEDDERALRHELQSLAGACEPAPVTPAAC